MMTEYADDAVVVTVPDSEWFRHPPYDGATSVRIGDDFYHLLAVIDSTHVLVVLDQRFSSS